MAGRGAVEPSVETLIKRHLTLGDFYFKEGRYSEASESYLRALTYAPEDASLHFVLADSLFAMGDYHYAAFIIKKALRIDPSMAYAEADKRTFYSDAKEFEKHLKTVTEYSKEKPFDAAAQLVLAYNLKFSGQKDRAIAAFKRLLEIDPDNHAGKLFLEALVPPKDGKVKGATSVESTPKKPKKKDN